MLFRYFATLCDSCGKIGRRTSPAMKHLQFAAVIAKSKWCAFVEVARFLVVASPVLVATSIAAEPLAKGIQDNSFFIEEAYNQEPGVVQHILNVPFNFTDGMSVYPHARNHDLINHNVGASAIFAVRPRSKSHVRDGCTMERRYSRRLALTRGHYKPLYDCSYFSWRPLCVQSAK